MFVFKYGETSTSNGPTEAIVTRLKLPDDDRLQMTNSLWPAQWSGVERSGAEWSGVVSPGNLRNENIGTPWEKTMGNLWGFLGDFWEIYVFFKGKSNFREIYVFFLRKPHFFSKSIFFRHGEVKKALLFLEGKHKRGSMMKSFIRFFSFGM